MQGPPPEPYFQPLSSLGRSENSARRGGSSRLPDFLGAALLHGGLPAPPSLPARLLVDKMTCGWQERVTYSTHAAQRGGFSAVLSGSSRRRRVPSPRRGATARGRIPRHAGLRFPKCHKSPKREETVRSELLIETSYCSI